MTARRARPMRRLISWVRPPMRPRTDSRSPRVLVARGSMAYSAVTQPSPLPLRQRGTPSVTEAVHRTLVSPKETRTEPSACLLQPRSMVTGRSCSGVRPSMRDMAQEPSRTRVGAPARGRAGPLGPGVRGGPGARVPVRSVLRTVVARCARVSHEVFDLGRDGVGVGSDDDLDGGAHLDDAVGARGLESGFVDLGGVDDLGTQAGDAALDLFVVVDAAEPGNPLLGLGGHVRSPCSEPLCRSNPQLAHLCERSCRGYPMMASRQRNRRRLVYTTRWTGDKPAAGDSRA